MPAYFDQAGRPRCSGCFHDLSAYGSSGHCPSCGKWFIVNRARVVPGRWRMLSLSFDTPGRIALEPSFSMTMLSRLFVVLGNAVVVGGIGYLAVRTLHHLFWP